jgi:hypothetical protein
MIVCAAGESSQVFLIEFFGALPKGSSGTVQKESTETAKESAVLKKNGSEVGSFRIDQIAGWFVRDNR